MKVSPMPRPPTAIFRRSCADATSAATNAPIAASRATVIRTPRIESSLGGRLGAGLVSRKDYRGCGRGFPPTAMPFRWLSAEGVADRVHTRPPVGRRRIGVGEQGTDRLTLLLGLARHQG